MGRSQSSSKSRSSGVSGESCGPITHSKSRSDESSRSGESSENMGRSQPKKLRTLRTRIVSSESSPAELVAEAIR